MCTASVIVVVRRGDVPLFESMRRRFEGDPSVLVVFDRRAGERRRGTAPVAEERRREERRRWDMLTSVGWAAVPVRSAGG